jgi:hypothetical protein
MWEHGVCTQSILQNVKGIYSYEMFKESISISMECKDCISILQNVQGIYSYGV